MPNTNVHGPLVCALLFDGFYAFEFQLTDEVFGLERPEVGAGWYRFATCAAVPSVRANRARISLQVDHGLEALTRADTIIVPGWPPEAAPSSVLRDGVRTAHARGARLISICSGAFLLAELGLLDGRRAATHWRYAASFEERFPRVRLEPDVLYVDEGDVMTSAGSAAGLDLLLHVVRKDFGVRVANTVARRLVVPPHREGGQLQYVETPVPTPREDGLSALLDAIRAAPSSCWTLDVMAARCGMSERTFSRRFVAATGRSPGRWLIDERVRTARAMLEAGGTPLDEIIASCGFGSRNNFERRFRDRVGVTPADYRRRFRDRGGPTTGQS